MKKILALAQKIRTNPKKMLPVVILCFAIIFSGVITYSLSPKQQSDTAVTQKTTPKTQVLAANTHIQKPSVTPITQKVLGASTDDDSQAVSAAPVVQQTSSQTTTQNSTTPTSTATQNQPTTAVSSQQNPTATPMPPTQPTPTTAVATVSMQIQDPAGTSNFTVTLSTGANACDVLQEAKNEGEITSVTFDDSYLSTLHSRYITEINGYQNNWTFTVNGNSPNGCSLSNPKPNDTIVWKFG